MNVSDKAVRWLTRNADDPSLEGITRGAVAEHELRGMPARVENHLRQAVDRSRERRELPRSIGAGVVGFDALVPRALVASAKFDPEAERALAAGRLAARWRQVWPLVVARRGELPPFGIMLTNGRAFDAHLWRTWAQQDAPRCALGDLTYLWAGEHLPDLRHFGTRAALLHWCEIRPQDLIDLVDGPDWSTLRRVRPVEDEAAFVVAMEIAAQ